MDNLQKLKQDLELLQTEHINIQNNIREVVAKELSDKIKIQLYAHYILVKGAIINVQSQIIEELEN
jgi:phosphomevalonate kinase